MAEEIHWLSEAEQRMWHGYPDSTRLLFRELDRQLVADRGIAFADFGPAKLKSASGGHAATVRRGIFDLLSPRDVASFAHACAQIRTNLLESS